MTSFRSLVLLLLCILFQFQINAQKLESIRVPSGATYKWDTTIKYLRELHMEDGSILEIPNGRVVEINVLSARLGKRCEIRGLGRPGIAGKDSVNSQFEKLTFGVNGSPGKSGGSGGNGTNGSVLHLNIYDLRELSSLIVNLNGGRGGNGGLGGQGEAGKLFQLERPIKDSSSRSSNFKRVPNNSKSINSKLSQYFLIGHAGAGGVGGDAGAGGNGGDFHLQLGPNSRVVPYLCTDSTKLLNKSGIAIYNSGGASGVPGLGGPPGEDQNIENIPDSLILYTAEQKAFKISGPKGKNASSKPVDGKIFVRGMDSNCLQEIPRSNAIIISIIPPNNRYYTKLSENSISLYNVLKKQYQFNRVDTLFNPSRGGLDSLFTSLANNGDYDYFIYLSGLATKDNEGTSIQIAKSGSILASDILNRVISLKTRRLLFTLNTPYSSGIFDSLRLERQGRSRDLINPIDFCEKSAKSIMYSTSTADIEATVLFGENIVKILKNNQLELITSAGLFDELIRSNVDDSGNAKYAKVKNFLDSDFIFFRKSYR